MERLLPKQNRDELLLILQNRFNNNMHRHEHLLWKDVLKRLEANYEKLWSLNEMERTGGEPDVIGYDALDDCYLFYDCSTESPKGRRSVCYDEYALNERKEHKPNNSALGMAKDMGVEIINEAEYRKLQQLGEFDTKTSSWIYTPDAIRQLDGALFCDRRYNHIFVYHNGASSYYSVRGFRARIKV